MVHKITLDRDRFKRKLRRLKQDGLRRFFQTESFGVIDTKGRVIRVPIKVLEIPQLQYGPKDKGGVAQGDGNVGDVIPNPYNEEEKAGGKKSGKGHEPTEHDYTEIDRSEIAEGLEELLGLPNLRETFTGEVSGSPSKRYSGIQPIGPQGLVNVRRSYMRALRRSVSSGIYDPTIPVVLPRKEDFRYKAPMVKNDANNVVVVYLLDCSGSMVPVLKFLQDVAWLADCWIDKEYPQAKRRYVHYDHLARESSASDFYSISAGGENHMGIAFQHVYQILKEYPPEHFNKYIVHLTDGDPYGLDIDEEDVSHYQMLIDMFPEAFEHLPIPKSQPVMHTGNPLLDRILPNINGLFVCEAGADYGDDDDPYKGNYSDILKQIVKDVPGIGNRIRCASFSYDSLVEGSDERRQSMLETMKDWFS
jgi:uncharacterized protein